MIITATATQKMFWRSGATPRIVVAAPSAIGAAQETAASTTDT